MGEWNEVDLCRQGKVHGRPMANHLIQMVIAREFARACQGLGEAEQNPESLRRFEKCLTVEEGEPRVMLVRHLER
jgi:hypothetical protein